MYFSRILLRIEKGMHTWLKRSSDDKKLSATDKLPDKRAVTSINMKMGCKNSSVIFHYSFLPANEV